MLSETAVGIEVTATSIRFVQLRKGFGGIEIANFGERPIPVESIEYSSSKDKVILETIKGLFNGKKVRFKNVAVSISRSSTYFRTLTLPPVKDDVIAPMIHNMAERHLPVRLNNAVYDFEYYKPDRKGSREVVLMGARRDDVTELVGYLKKSGISVMSVEPSTLSSYRLVEDLMEGDEAEIVHLFVGENEVHINLFRGGRLLASRVLELQTELLMSDTASYAKELCACILESSGSIDLIPGQDTLSGKILLTASEETTGLLQDPIAQTLGVEVMPVTSPQWLQKGAGLDMSRYGVSLGLAAGTFLRSSLSLNLIPQETKEKRRRDELIKTGILAGANVFLLIVLLATISFRRERELSLLTSEIDSLKPRVQSAERVKREYLDAIRIESSIEEIEQEKADWLNLLNGISSILPEDAWLTRIELEKGNPVLLAGMASSAANLIPVLEESPLLENVKFEAPTTTTNVGGKQVENFRITANLKKGGDEIETDTER